MFNCVLGESQVCELETNFYSRSSITYCEQESQRRVLAIHIFNFKILHTNMYYSTM